MTERYVIHRKDTNEYYNALKEVDKSVVNTIKDICCTNTTEEKLNDLNNGFRYKINLVAFNTIEIIKEKIV